MLKLGNPLLFLLSLLGLPFQLPRRGNHTEKENVSLLPIRTCKQKANHAASLCILKQSNKPTATCLPGLPAQGWPACRADEGYVARDRDTASQPPPGTLTPSPNHPGRQEAYALSLARPCGSGLSLPSPGKARPAGAAPGCLPARLLGCRQPQRRTGPRLPGAALCLRDEPPPRGGTPPSTPSSRPPG